MPTCPGCERHVPHDGLDAHLRTCTVLLDENPSTLTQHRELDASLATVERRLSMRISAIESTLEAMEPATVSRSGPGGLQ